MPPSIHNYITLDRIALTTKEGDRVDMAFLELAEPVHFCGRDYSFVLMNNLKAEVTLLGAETARSRWRELVDYLIRLCD